MSVDSETEKLLRSFWRNWAIAAGAINLPLLSALLLPRLCIPFICIAELYVLSAVAKNKDDGAIHNCTILYNVAAQALAIAAAIMLAIAILCTDRIFPAVIRLEFYNADIPFISGLIIFPVLALLCCLWLYGGVAENHCSKCQHKYGKYSGDDFVGMLYYKEARYQLKIVMFLASATAAVEYLYYFMYYININMNDPDRFFFNWLPLGLYAISLFFMAGRYATMKVFLDKLAKSMSDRNNRTIVRFLILSDSDMLLHCGKDGMWDTPAEVVKSRQHAIGEPEARLLVQQIIGISEFDIRYCFTNNGFATGSNVIHFAVFVDDANRAKISGEDIWFNAYMLDSALATNSLSPVLANELYRIHAMTMAWKTYDRSGKRIYPIRHYRPTFRLRDLKKWQIDYDDLSWFEVANNNEDRTFYRLRRLWNKVTDVFRRKCCNS